MKFMDLQPHYEISKKEIYESIERVFEHGQYIMGPEVQEAEKRLSEFTQAHAVVCNNGTTALHLALLACGVQPGDEVIVPAFTFIATSETVNLIGATPVFVDVNLDDFNIIPSAIESAITEKTKAIIAVSLFGQPADFLTINEIGKKHNITVIEDGAQSFGATHHGQRSCNLSPISTTSFFPAKPLGVFGDGGAVFSQDPKIAEKLKHIRNHGSEVRYRHEYIGINGRLNSIQCAFLIERLKHYPNDIENRSKVAQVYLKNFKSFNDDRIQLPFIHNENSSVWAQFTIKVKEREKIQNYLKEKGIPTAIHYPIPLPDQPVYKNNTAPSRSENYENSKQLAQEVMSLPFYPTMSTSEIETVCAEVKNGLDS